VTAARAPEVVGIGEALVRLAPVGNEVLETAAAYAVHVGGAEGNVCANLAGLGVRTAWISRLPGNPLGRRIARAFQSSGVDTGAVVWAPHGRAGVMFIQPGAAPRAGQILYYRRDSAFAQIDPDEVVWTTLDGAAFVHLTGITPALGDRPRRLVERAIAEGRRRGARMSFGVNYRSTLWSPEAAREALEPLLRGLDLVFVNERDARGVFAAAGEPDEIAGSLRARFGCTTLVLTLGERGALAHDGRAAASHPAHRTEIVDRVGRGDAFVAGYLYACLRGDAADALRYGNALAALKQTYPGDVSHATLSDVEAVLGGRSGGFVR
jgi:2-dehydro-3-deoxygluconokinase